MIQFNARSITLPFFRAGEAAVNNLPETIRACREALAAQATKP
jgi:hypothetical protein